MYVSINRNTIKSILNFYIFNSYNFVLILITLSSFKFFGYAVGFIFLAPILYFNKNKIFSYIKTIDTEQKFVLAYFLYLFFESFYGFYTLKDIRIILYWPIFFLICTSSYLYNNHKLSKDKIYQTNYQETIFKASNIYFIIYLLMNIISFIIYGNEYDIQNLFWVGGSTSFNISTILLFIIYLKWSKLNFKLNSIYLVNSIFYLFIMFLNESRFSQLYFFSFLLFIFLRSIKLKCIINSLLIIIISFYGISISSKIIYKIKSTIDSNTNYFEKTIVDETNQNLKNIFNIRKEINDNLITNGDTGRVVELFIGIEKFKTSTITEKIIGSGWYSSRITINETRDRIIDEKGIGEDLYKTKVTHLQGIISLLIDTGLIGFIFTIFLFSISLRKILFFNYYILDKLFYLILILLNFFCLFIGYPWINLPFIFLFIPKGIFLLEDMPKSKDQVESC